MKKKIIKISIKFQYNYKHDINNITIVHIPFNNYFIFL